MSDLLKQLQTCGTKFINNHEQFDSKVFADYIAKDNRITSVSLAFYIGDSGRNIKIIGEALRENATVETLKLRHPNFPTREDFLYFCEILRHTRIQKFTLVEFNTGVHDFSNLNVRSLSLILIGPTLSQQHIKDILSNSNLESLSLSGVNFRDDDMEMVAEALRNNKLTKLSLKRCSITNVFNDVLRYNTSLTSLNLTGSYLNVNSLVDALRNNKTLKSLDLSRTGCNNDNFDVLIQTNIEKLRIFGSAISDLSLMKSNTTLVNLSFSTERIATAGFAILADVLSENTTLKTLSIDVTNIFEIDSDNLRLVIKSLRKNTTLEILTLCPLIDEDMIDLDEKLGELRNQITKWFGLNYTLKEFNGAFCKSFLSEEQRMKRMQKVRRLMCTKKA